MAYLLDTHTLVWAFDRRDKLGAGALSALTSEGRFFVSPVSLYEIAYKASLGKWPAMVGRAAVLSDMLPRARIDVAPLDLDICIHAGQRDWTHRDPFDRLIASTAELRDLTLVTRDPAFATLPGLRTVW